MLRYAPTEFDIFSVYLSDIVDFMYIIYMIQYIRAFAHSELLGLLLYYKLAR